MRITDRQRIVRLIGEARVAALEAQGFEVALELTARELADAEGAVSAVEAELVGLRATEIRSQRLMATGELGAGIVHEVRNMVAAIRGFAQVGARKLESGDDPGPLLSLIESESGRCEDTLSRFLGFARAVHPLEVADVNQIAARAIALVRHRLAVDGVRIIESLTEGLPAVRARIGEIEQILVNLALNAQQAMAGPGTVWFETRAGGDGSVYIEVADDGPGIAPDVRSRVFEPFFTTRPNGGGTGLGLAVAARIAEQHGGALSLVDSDVGARFRVGLPEARE